MNSTDKKYSDAIPVSVIDDLIEELDSESEECASIFTHAIITLQMLKNRWERMQKGDDGK